MPHLSSKMAISHSVAHSGRKKKKRDQAEHIETHRNDFFVVVVNSVSKIFNLTPSDLKLNFINEIQYESCFHD